MGYLSVSGMTDHVNAISCGNALMCPFFFFFFVIVYSRVVATIIMDASLRCA